MANSVIAAKELSLEARLMLAGMSANKVTQFSDIKSDITVKKRVREELGYLPKKAKTGFSAMLMAVCQFHTGGVRGYGQLLSALGMDSSRIEESMDHLWRGMIDRAAPWQLRAMAHLADAVLGIGITYRYVDHYSRWAAAISSQEIPCPQNLAEVEVSWVDWILQEFQLYAKPFYDPQNRGGDALISYLKEVGLEPREWEVIELHFGLRYGLEPKTFNQVIEELGVRREKAKQLEAYGLRKLRRHWPDFKKKFWPDEA